MNPNQPSQTPQPPQVQTPPTEHQPVAYDATGRPLYAHPPTTPVAQPNDQTNETPQVVHMIRAVEPMKQEVSEAVKQKHAASKEKYPYVNLSDGEYILRDVRRHPIGLFLPMGLGTILISMVFALLFNYDLVVQSLDLTGIAADPLAIVLPAFLFLALVGLGMYVVYYVYTNNKFFLTNESVIQEIQISLFARKEQTVSLGNIEDASFRQDNIIQHLFNYGSIRLSTEGDETTYRFTYVSNPKEHIATLNNAVENFKLGRPVDPHDN